VVAATMTAMSCTERIRYHDRIAALLTLASAQRCDGSGRPRIEQRVYRCPHCCWHVTSQSRRGQHV